MGATTREPSRLAIRSASASAWDLATDLLATTAPMDTTISATAAAP
jgi:hypothetical protein